MWSPAPRISLRPLAVILVLASATSAALVGCSGTPEDEVPTAGTGGTGTAGTGTGGTGTGGTGTGGTAGAATGGTAGAPTAGAAGSGAGSTGLPDVGCDYTLALGRSCAIAGCHRPAEIVAGNLDLTPDAGLRSRLVDVPAKHSMIVCDPAKPNDFCVPAACPTTAKLLDSANPDSSWIFAKLGMTPTGCGDTMPMPPGNAADRWTTERQACLQTFFRALAALGPAPGAGGTGAGGSSGASAGGSGGVATGGSAGTTGGGGNGGVATGGAGASSGGAGASSGGSAGSITAGNAGSGGARAGSGGQGGANGGVSGSN